MVLIHLSQIKGGELHLEGESEEDILDLPGEPIRQLGPVRYWLDIGQKGASVWATGRIAVEIELECAHCLDRFPYPVAIGEFAVQFDHPAGETIDLTPSLREDILFVLPPYPDCRRDGGRQCPARQHSAGGGTERRSAPGQGAGAVGPWSRLDELNLGEKGS